MEELLKGDQCKIDASNIERFREEIPGLVDRLVLSCERDECFDHVSPEPLPSKDAVTDLIKRAQRILFPGYFMRARVDKVNIGYYYGQEVTTLFESLSEQIMLSIRHECLRYNQPCTQCLNRGHEAAVGFISDHKRSFLKRSLPNRNSGILQEALKR